jgi:hypothetical protein
VTPKNDLLTRRLLADEGGPLQVGAVVELGETSPDPNPPETEDHLIDPDMIEPVDLLSHDEYIPVNDLRFYEEDNITVRRDVFADVHKRILYDTGVWRGPKSRGCTRGDDPTSGRGGKVEATLAVAPGETLALAMGVRSIDISWYAGDISTPPPVNCVVPKLRGKRSAPARRQLAEAHCRVGRVTHRLARRADRGRVTGQ